MPDSTRLTPHFIISRVNIDKEGVNRLDTIKKARIKFIGGKNPGNVEGIFVK